ncbi:Aminotransferase-like mobile domain-containing protein [Artemisia annua]|uniref:Aminotransferase-like mobile domain-containing protein n=3 Tax=Artemisia annua TaxID=35608 RepID=A0A2U1M006_ARTAN|nr:Aminotransferase-like mobile domain-containing protein [Artemisia annua]
MEMDGYSSPDFDRTNISPLVDSDEESMSSKRKEVSSLEIEGSRRKKKKKNGGTPRPACSWVHFSREFIKEYSASHPESSGLKSATKAASNAWKVMSLQEKEIYAKRAREVWDDYLSSTPAREPKPKKQANLVTRCSPGRLVNVIKRFTPDQKEAVKSIGFGSLLDLKCRTLRRSLCLWLLERFNTIRRSLEICGERVPLSPRDVELVMGLPASGKEVVNSGPDELVADLRLKYNASNRGISVRFLEGILGESDSGEDFKRAFLLYVLGTLLCPTARLEVSPSFLHFLTDMDSVHEYNWAKFLLDKLVREVSRFRQGKQRAVGGCLLFLQLFYYECVAIGRPSELGPVVVPCLSSWTEENISEREKHEKELGGYGCGEVICRERGLGLSLHIDKADVDMLPLRQVTLRANCNFQPSDEDNLESYSYNNTMDFSIMNHEIAYSQSQSQTACPLPTCNFTGQFENLSDHFSSKHWDSGLRFQYNCPLNVSLGMDETFLVLQAAENGFFFLLNKGTENIGHTVTITCIGPCSSSEQFLYYLVSERGNNSLRLKAYTQSLRAKVDGIPPSDFLLVPFGYLNSCGELNLEVCIWNSSDLVGV